MKRYLTILIAVGALAVSCEKILDVDDSGPRELVLNGVPAAGKEAFVYFAQTRFFLDSSVNQPVEGAAVTLTVNGTPMPAVSEDRCKYFFGYTLQESDELAVDINTADGRTVHAETYVPKYPDLSGFAPSRFESPSFKLFKVDLRLTDHADLNEYYSIAITERDSGARYNEWKAQFDTVDTVHATYFLVPYNPKVTSNEVCPYVPLGGYLYTRIMFMDKLIAGQQEDLQLFILQTVVTNEVEPFKHEYFVQVESVTPARWNYIISSSQQSSLFSVFAEQGDVWSNVEGGLGIFAGTASRKYAFCPDTLGSSQPVPASLLHLYE